MDKKTLIKVIVGIVIVLFVLEPVAISFLNSGFNPNQNIKVGGQGRAQLEMKLNDYKNYIVIDKDYEGKDEEIKKIKGVRDFLVLSDKAVVETKDVFNVYKELRKMGLRGTSDANIEVIKAYVGDRDLNASNTFSLTLEPLIKEGTTMYGQMDVVYDENGRVLQVGNFNLILETKKINASFKIKEKLNESYEYVIDWENRSKVISLGYDPNNAVIVNNTNIQKEDYVYYVGNGYILVNESMTNKSKVMEDYGVIEFKDTIIYTNESMDIDFAKKKSIKYTYLVVNDEYGVEKIIESYEKLNPGDTISLEVDAVYSKDALLYIDVSQ